MPLYDFRCTDCDRELILILTEEQYRRKDYRCPRCRSRYLEPIPDAVAPMAGKK